MTEKLSAIMKRGAAKTKEAKHLYVATKGDDICACAVGCALYEVTNELLNFNDGHVEEFLVPIIGYSLFDARIHQSRFPQDVLEETDADCYTELSLHNLITITNDIMGRDRAIQVVEELGY